MPAKKIKKPINKFTADIGVFGGSGFYSFLDNVKEIQVKTPYGNPSDKISIAEIAGKKVAFLPRHGKHHQLPPHKVNYRANIAAFKQLGIKKIIGPCAAGSLQKEIKPGDFVVCDDFVDQTEGRISTFYEGPKTVHVHMADAYCPELRKLAIQSIKQNNITCHEKGTVVVIKGPRFATRAESKSYSRNGWEVINMTQVPEAYLAKEADLCYVNISLITDYDIGVEGVEPSELNKILQTFKANNEKLKSVLFKLIELMPIEQNNCQCKNTLTHSAIN